MKNKLAKEKFSNGKPYFLFVGSQSPRKNLKRLISAFEIFKKQTQSDFKLILVGAVYSSEGDVKKVIDKSVFKNDILFIGRQPQNELENIMAGLLLPNFCSIF